jgi:arsenate reductase (glutaredoxin)
MNKVYFLKTCSTCTRILSGLNLDGFEKIEIKSQGISLDQLNEMEQLSGSYESLFSKSSMKYKSLGLKDQILKEEDFKKYILEEYTFLKRPVFIIDNEIFIGNSKSVVEQLYTKIVKK